MNDDDYDEDEAWMLGMPWMVASELPFGIPAFSSPVNFNDF